MWIAINYIYIKKQNLSTTSVKWKFNTAGGLCQIPGNPLRLSAYLENAHHQKTLAVGRKTPTAARDFKMEA